MSIQLALGGLMAAFCFFLTVDAYLDAVPFYVKNEFQFMNAEDNDPHTRLMYYDLMDLEE